MVDVFRLCTRVKVLVTLDASVQYSSGEFSNSELSPGPLHKLAAIFLFSSPSVIELSTLTCTSIKRRLNA